MRIGNKIEEFEVQFRQIHKELMIQYKALYSLVEIHLINQLEMDDIST